MSWARVGTLIAAAGGLAFLCFYYGGELLGALARADPRYFLLYAIVAALVRFGHIVRWLAIARALRTRCPAGRLATARLAADALGSVSPAGPLWADPVRVMLTLGCGDRVSRLGAGVALDRVVETIGSAVAAMAYIAVFWAVGASGRGALGGLAIALTAGLVALTTCLMLLARGHDPLAPVYRIVDISRARWLRVMMVSVRRAQRHVRDLVRLRPWVAVGAIGGSVVIEALMLLEYSLVFRAFGAFVDVPMVMLSMLIGGMARAAPTPGGLGVFEAGQIAAFGVALGQPELGFTVAIITRLHQLLWVGIGCAVLLASGVPTEGWRYRAGSAKASATSAK